MTEAWLLPIRIEVGGAAIIEVDDGIVTVSKPAALQPDWSEIHRFMPVPDTAA